MQRILPPVLVLLLGLGATALHFVLGLQAMAAMFRLVGFPIALGGLAMSLWGSRHFEAVGTNIRTFDEPDLLISDGLYQWSRNPMYLGFLILLAGVALGLGSWAGLMAPAVFFIAADRWYIPFEEELMRDAFNGHYESYSRQVRRWVGRRTV